MQGRPRVWQALRDDLRTIRPNAEVVLVAPDETSAEVRPWVEGVDLPVLIDADRVFTARYGIINVTTVIWIDESDRFARAPDQVFADNRLAEHHGLDSTAYHDALRQWLSNGRRPGSPPKMALRAEQRRGRAHFRLALWLWRQGRIDDARQQLEVESRLDPEDFTVRRAGLALMGADPFGTEFGEIYAQWMQLTGGRGYPRR